MKDANPVESRSIALYLHMKRINRNHNMHEVSSSHEKEAKAFPTLQTGKSDEKENWLCFSRDVQSATVIVSAPFASLFKSRQSRPDGETDTIRPYSDSV